MARKEYSKLVNTKLLNQVTSRENVYNSSFVYFYDVVMQ